MSSTKVGKRYSKMLRAGFVAITLVASVVVGAACTAEEWGGGGEGDRCNPNLSHNECGGGLQCTQPALCPENYCCPTSGVSGNAYCQTGCNGGAASICAADQDPDACAFALGPVEAGTTTAAGD